MNFAELRDLIRAEADIQGLAAYSNLIDNLINNELQRLTGKSKYPQLREELTFTLVADEEHSFNLPDDYQLFDSLVYTPDPTGRPFYDPYPLSTGTSTGSQTCTEGYPQYWNRVGNTIKIYPYTSFYIGDSLVLSYYKRPELIADADIFPVETLANVVQLYVMARMMRMRDTKASLLMKAEADQAYRDSRTEVMGS